MAAVIYLIAAFLASTGVFLIARAVYNERIERRERVRQPLSVGDQAEAWLRSQ